MWYCIFVFSLWRFYVCFPLQLHFYKKKAAQTSFWLKMYNCLHHSNFVISAKSLQAQLSSPPDSKCSIVLTTHARTTSLVLCLDASIEVDLVPSLPSVAACSQLCSSAQTVLSKSLFHSKLSVPSHMMHWNAGVSDSLILISLLSHSHTNGDLVVFTVDVVIHHPWLIVHKQLLGRPSLDCPLVPLPVPQLSAGLSPRRHVASEHSRQSPAVGLWAPSAAPQSSGGTVTHCCWSPASISYRHDPLKTLTIRDVSPSRGGSVGEDTCLLWDRRHLAVLPNHIIKVRPESCVSSQLSARLSHWRRAGLTPLKGTPPYFLNPLLPDNKPVWRSRMSKWFRYVNGSSGWSNWTQRTSDPQLGRTFFFKAAFLNSLLLSSDSKAVENALVRLYFKASCGLGALLGVGKGFF